MTTLCLLDVIDAIGEEFAEREARQDETADLVELGARGMHDDLRMTLHAHCAARGIDWPGLLADAVRDCISNRSLN